MRQIRNLYCFSLLLALTFHSCKQVSKETFYNSPLSDSVSTFSFSKPENIQNFTLELTNSSDHLVKFYLTPAEADLFNTTSVVNSLLKNATTDSAKALKLFHFVCNYYFHGYRPPTQCTEPHNPAILLNSLESGYCDDASAVLANLGKVAGLLTQVIELNGHVVMQFFYDNSWHLFDPDKRVYYQNKNAEVASLEQLYSTPKLLEDGLVSHYQNRDVKALVKQQNRNLILSKEDNSVGSWYQDLFPDYNSTITLRGNDFIVFGLSSNSYLKKKVLVEWLENRRRYYQRNGCLTRHIKLYQQTFIHAEKSPYAINRISISSPHAVRNSEMKVFYSTDRTHWYFKGIVSTSHSLSFDPNINPKRQLTFGYYLKFETISGCNEPAQVQNVEVQNNFVFSDKLFFNNNTHSFMAKGLDSNYRQIKATIQIERIRQ